MIQSGVCQFCHVTDEQVDGDGLRWHNGARTCCSAYACVRRFYAQLANARRRFQGTHLRSSADVHRRIVEERRARNRRYRQAAKARKQGGEGGVRP